jgi:predicted homoserine dehydrogenase-like protein
MAYFDYVISLLREREDKNNPIRVAVLGAGWYGEGVIQELMRCPGMIPKIVFDRNLNRALAAYQKTGVLKDQIVCVETVSQLKKQLMGPRYIISNRTELLSDLSGIDVLFEATGHVKGGAEAALAVMPKGIHFVTISSELDCTIGSILKQMANEMGVVYSVADGDQPGVLKRMIEYVQFMGFEIIVAGNCKGFLDVHKTPKDIQPWVRPGHNPQMITAFTDGTKQSAELCVLANAVGLIPDKRGMHGPTTTKERLVEEFLKVISHHGIVDYVLGINGVNQGAGIFVVGKREGEKILADMEYLKKGKGPYYLFFRDEHLCYFESILTIAEAFLFKVPTLVPAFHLTEVISVAKKNLTSGEKLDGMGGYTAYGLLDTYENAHQENLLPMGLAEFAVVRQNVPQDTPITYDMVDFGEDNIVLGLRRKQDEIIRAAQPSIQGKMPIDTTKSRPRFVGQDLKYATKK